MYSIERSVDSRVFFLSTLRPSFINGKKVSISILPHIIKRKRWAKPKNIFTKIFILAIRSTETNRILICFEPCTCTLTKRGWKSFSLVLFFIKVLWQMALPRKLNYVTKQTGDWQLKLVVDNQNGKFIFHYN